MAAWLGGGVKAAHACVIEPAGSPERQVDLKEECRGAGDRVEECKGASVSMCLRVRGGVIGRVCLE